MRHNRLGSITLFDMPDVAKNTNGLKIYLKD
jgi:hypothetical protein